VLRSWVKTAGKPANAEAKAEHVVLGS
jgi:hypothetical protein